MNMQQMKIRKALDNNTHVAEITLGNQKISLLRITDFERLLQAVEENDFNQDERLPYWADLWPSSVALAEYILCKEQYLHDKKIIELGCGLGLAGIAAARMGAQVLFTDYDTLALSFTRKNYYMNFKKYPTVKLLDWRHYDLTETFDYVLAADVLYERRFFPFLHRIFTLLISNGTVAVITEPKRTVARSWDRHFHSV